MRPSLRIDISEPTASTVVVSAVGDTCLRSDATLERLRSGEPLVAPEIARQLSGSDVALANVECPIAPESDPVVKAGTRLRGIAEMIPALESSGIGIACLANNHILDFGEEGMQTTWDALVRGGIDVVGVGRDEAQAAQPHWLEAGGLRVAVLAFAEREFGAATREHGGAALLDPVTAGRAIRAARGEADLVIASVHGGNEHYFAPSPRTQEWYRSLVESGAHAVLGHHPHAVQGVEVHHGAPIVYSLGNFAFDAPGPMAASWDEGMLATLKASAAGVHSLELYALRQEREGGTRLRSLTASEDHAFGERQQTLNRIASDPLAVEAHWRCFCEARSEFYNQRLLIDAETVRVDLKEMTAIAVQSKSQQHIGSILSQLVSRIPWRREMRPQRFARLVNLFQCPAHHEVMTTILRMQHEGVTPDPDAADEFERLIQHCR